MSVSLIIAITVGVIIGEFIARAIINPSIGYVIQYVKDRKRHNAAMHDYLDHTTHGGTWIEEDE